MPGRDYSAHQRKIIQGYYEHADTIALQKLGETVSELYLAHGSKAEKLWATARTALLKLIPMEDPRLINVLRTRSVTALAQLVTDLSAAVPGKDSPQSAQRAQSVEKGAQLIETSEAGAASGASQRADSAPGGGEADDQPSVGARPGPVTPEQLRSAMKAFRRRLKLTRLDEESKLGRNPMSAGKKSSIVAILAPREFPQAVWDELVRQGQLKYTGGGFYELVE